MGEEVERATRSALERAGASVDETSLVFSNPGALRWEDFEALARDFLAPVGIGYPWWVGDLLNMAEDVLGEDWAQLEAYFPHSPQTQANYKSIAKNIPRSRRRGLHLSTAAEVAYLPPRVRDEFIDKAVKGGWRREEMREARRAAALSPASGTESVAVLPAPPKKVCPHCGVVLED